MKTILNSHWNKKRVTVSISEYYFPNGFNASFRMRIRVEETYLLPSKFDRGFVHTANIDVINTIGGLPNYVAKILNDAALNEQRRRKQVIDEQFILL